MSSSRCYISHKPLRIDSICTGSHLEEILDCIKRASNVLEPADLMTSCLAAVGPKHSLEVLAHGPRKIRFRVEADIDMIDGAIEGQGKGMWQIGATTYHQHDNRRIRLMVGTISLER